MKQRFQKYLAREVLILFASCLFTFFLSLSLYGYNFFTQKKVDKLYSKVTQLNNYIITIQNSNNYKYYELYLSLKSNPNVIGLPPTFSTFKSGLSLDTKARRFYNLVSVTEGLKNFPKNIEDLLPMTQPNEFLYFLPITREHEFKRILDDKISMKNNLQNKTKYFQSKIYSEKDLYKLIIYLGTILFTVIYPIRFLIVIIRWSIKTYLD